MRLKSKCAKVRDLDFCFCCCCCCRCLFVTFGIRWIVLLFDEALILWLCFLQTSMAMADAVLMWNEQEWERYFLRPSSTSVYILCTQQTMNDGKEKPRWKLFYLCHGFRARVFCVLFRCNFLIECTEERQPLFGAAFCAMADLTEWSMMPKHIICKWLLGLSPQLIEDAAHCWFVIAIDHPGRRRATKRGRDTYIYIHSEGNANEASVTETFSPLNWMKWASAHKWHWLMMKVDGGAAWQWCVRHSEQWPCGTVAQWRSNAIRRHIMNLFVFFSFLLLSRIVSVKDRNEANGICCGVRVARARPEIEWIM